MSQPRIPTSTTAVDSDSDSDIEMNTTRVASHGRENEQSRFQMQGEEDAESEYDEEEEEEEEGEKTDVEVSHDRSWPPPTRPRQWPCSDAFQLIASYLDRRSLARLESSDRNSRQLIRDHARQLWRPLIAQSSASLLPQLGRVTIYRVVESSYTERGLWLDFAFFIDRQSAHDFAYARACKYHDEFLQYHCNREYKNQRYPKRLARAADGRYEWEDGDMNGPMMIEICKQKFDLGAKGKPCFHTHKRL